MSLTLVVEWLGRPSSNPKVFGSNPAGRIFAKKRPAGLEPKTFGLEDLALTTRLLLSLHLDSLKIRETNIPTSEDEPEQRYIMIRTCLSITRLLL